MYSFKGFAVIPALVNNTNGITAAVGELSGRSLTFSKDIKTYAAGNGLVNLHCFNSKTTVNNNNAATPPVAIVNKAVAITSWIQTRQTGLVGTESLADFTLAFTSQWSTSTSAVDIGAMVTTESGKSFPSFITYSTSDYTVEVNTTKIWFADAAFQDQYDEYSIVVVPPLPNLDDFLGNYSDVLVALAQQRPDLIYARIQTARAGHPETVLLAESYDLVSQQNSTLSTPTYWPVLIYGPRGDFTDAVRAAVTDYIATTSSVQIPQWKLILPDIFRTTEFMLVPNWTNMAILDRTLTAGIYSQIVNLGKEITYMKTVVPDYAASHVSNNAQVMTHTYKNLIIGCIGNAQNRGNKFALTDVYPDLLNVSTTSPDFGRMSTSTQGLLIHLATMIPLAETMNLFTEIPSAYRKVVRSGILYITVTYENIVYLVAAKSTVPVLV